MGRREFLKCLGIIAGGALTSGALEACAAQTGFIDEPHRRATMKALLDILLPARRGRPGANDVRALELLRGDKFIKTAVNMGYFPKLAERFAGAAGFILESTLASALDRHPLTVVGRGRWWGLPLRRAFKDLPPVQRRRIVRDLQSQRAIVPAGPWDLAAARKRLEGEALELARVTAIFAYAGGVLSEEGLVRGLGWPRYQDFARGKHNAGYPLRDDPATGRLGFSYNRWPEANGLRAEAWSDTLGNPL